MIPGGPQTLMLVCIVVLIRIFAHTSSSRTILYFHCRAVVICVKLCYSLAIAYDSNKR